MKKIATILSALALSLTSAFAQFEGTITYSMEFEGLPPEAQAMMGESNMSISIKGEKTRTEVITPMSQNITINNNATKTTITLLDIMGEKYMIKGSPEKKDEKEVVKPEIKYIDGETKMIAGYKCKKAEITLKNKKGESTTSVVWYTDELTQSYTNREFEGLKGVPMEYALKQQGMTQKLTAKKVTAEKIDDSKFEAPKTGYKETTWEEFSNEMKKFGGGQ